MKPINVAVVGVGHLGTFHAQKLSQLSDFRLVAVVDPLPEHRTRAVEKLATRACADYRELLGQIDAAVVATPTSFHHAVALDLVRHGIHTFVEKPLAVTVSEADQLVAAADQATTVLQVGHVERFNEALRAARPHVSQPKFIEAVRRGGFSFRSTDIGVVLDLMIHDIDVILSFVASPVRSVDALGISLFGRHEDVANARLEFENGCVATLSASRASRTAERTMQIWSRQGVARLDFAGRSVSLIRPSMAILRHEVDVDRMSPAEKAAQRDGWLDRHLPLETIRPEPGDQLTAELLDFAHAIHSGVRPQVAGKDGRDAIEVAEQILAKIASHAWDGTPQGPIGPLALEMPAILPGPHWEMREEHRGASVPEAPPRREAG